MGVVVADWAGRRSDLGRVRPCISALAVAALALAVFGSIPAQANATKVDIELNKLEALEKGCRATVVVNNETPAEFEAFKLDLVVFRPDGVVGRQLRVNLGPLKASKRFVKAFDLEGASCDDVGSLLINDVTDCKSAAGPVTDCLAGLTVRSITKVQLSK